ncbi:MAG: hypothetical protein ACPGJS_07370 [Flammeovirgaceae bacterium]
MENQQSIFALSVSKFYLIYLVMMVTLMIAIGVAFFEKDIVNLLNGQEPTNKATAEVVLHNKHNKPLGFQNI